MRKAMRKTLIGAAATAAALTLTLAAPANAERFGIDDPIESGHGVDLLAVSVVNAEKNLRVVLTHKNLRRDPRTGAGGAFYIDTDPDDKGPELVFAGGYFDGTDYQLVATEGFGVDNWKAPVKGYYRMTLDYAKETTRMVISRRALGGADDVRVAVRVGGQRTDGTQVVDWMGKPRSFTLWLDRG
jgi:hypothetical protein